MRAADNQEGTGLHWTDVLFVPFAIVGSFALARWLALPLAITASLVISLLIFSVFERRKRSFKRFILGVVTAATITFILAAIRYWLM